MTPEWFIANQHRYDDFKEEDSKVFLGEYASWGNTWYNALVEAAYMTGLERNAGKVSLACYAPMLCHTDYVNWKPDMIWFNNHQAFGTANYYVQKMFMNYHGDSLLEDSFRSDGEPKDLMPEKARLSGKIALDYRDADVEYSDIHIINEETGEELHPADVTINADNKNVTLADLDSGKYTIRMKAKELTGSKGFFLEFNKQDEENKMFWELGAWQNLDSAVTEMIHGKTACLSQYNFSVEQGREYLLELKVDGRKIQAYVDGQLYQDIYLKPVLQEPLYTSASLRNDGSVILKVVNISDTIQELDVHMHGMGGKTNMGRMIRMSGYELDAENSFEEPEKVAPFVTGIVSEAGDILLDIPAHSVSVIVISKEESYTVPA
jgi:alpha-L-arabinofuranosidase